MTFSNLEDLKETLESFGQSHLLEFWETLNEQEQSELFNDISSINFEEVIGYFNKCYGSTSTVNGTNGLESIDEIIQPPSPEIIGSYSTSSESDLENLNEIGLKEIALNKVAVLLLAGGQGTRLGVSYPKGQYNVDLFSKKTLYQLQAERIVKLQNLAAQFSKSESTPIIPWYIMVSEHTKQATIKFFQDHNYFGLDPENVVIFQQYLLPCFTFDGKIILETKSKIAKAPDGNGGLYRALYKDKLVDSMQKRGVEHIHVYCVDNILVKLADPLFIGFCKSRSVECGNKSVEKFLPNEAVGVVCKIDKHYQVVEYSEISSETAEKKDANGKLAFRHGNIANHYFSVQFLNTICEKWQFELTHHVAKKKIKFVGEDGCSVKPSTNNGIKMEKFVFDVFQFATDSDFAIWEVLREDEFSPLKNADGAADSTPTTCRNMMLDLSRRLVVKAGGKFEESDDQVQCEISPLLSYFGEGLESIVQGKTFKSPLVLYHPSENIPNIINSV